MSSCLSVGTVWIQEQDGFQTVNVNCPGILSVKSFKGACASHEFRYRKTEDFLKPEILSYLIDVFAR